MRIRMALAFAAVCAAPLVASASIFDIYGFGPRGRAMGNAQVAAADDYTAAFYNPAALTVPKKVIIGAGFIATMPRLRVDRAYGAEGQREIGNVLPPDFSGISVGALFPLGGVFEDRVALGFGLYLPTLNLVRGEGVDPFIPQFYRYQSLPDKFVIVSCLAVEITPWLSIGGGVQVLASLDGDIGTNLEIANRRVRNQQVIVEFSPSAAPIAGVYLHPLKGLSVGLSYRQNIQLDYQLPTSLKIDDLISFDVDIGGTVLYSPDYFNVGAAYEIEPANLLVSGEISHAIWSKAPDPSPTFAIDIGGDLLDSIGLDERLDVGNGAPVVLNFRDVTTVKLGVEQSPTKTVHLRAGYTWRPSPAPVPTGAFNYIDNDAQIFALGLGISFEDPLEIRRNPFHLDLVYQATLLADQSVSKSAGDDDLVGDYVSGGTIHSFGIAIRHDL